MFACKMLTYNFESTNLIVNINVTCKQAAKFSERRDRTKQMEINN